MFKAQVLSMWVSMPPHVIYSAVPEKHHLFLCIFFSLSIVVYKQACMIVTLLKDKYPNFEVGLKCILMVFPYLLLCSYINENAMLTKNGHECY